jgi:integrase
VKFLTELFKGGIGYSALNTARCALSTILPKYQGYSFGTHPSVCWLLKGGYEERPPGARHSKFWDVRTVLDLFKKWGKNSSLSLRRLSIKLAMLLLLVSAQRGQTIMSLDIENLVMEEGSAIFKLKTLLKHNRLGDPLDTLVLQAFPECKRLCVVNTLREYLARTGPLRAGKSGQLLISYKSPYNPISRNTLSRWTAEVLEAAGISTSRYSLHSTRGATTSAARLMGVPIDQILKTARWRSARSFAVFYNKEVDVDPNMATSILKQMVNR